MIFVPVVRSIVLQIMSHIKVKNSYHHDTQEYLLVVHVFLSITFFANFLDEENYCRKSTYARGLKFMQFFLVKYYGY